MASAAAAAAVAATAAGVVSSSSASTASLLEASAGLSPEQLHELRQAFDAIDTDKNRVLDRGEIAQLLMRLSTADDSALAAGPVSEQQLQEEVEFVMQAFDASAGDGVVTYDHFVNAIAQWIKSSGAAAANANRRRRKRGRGQMSAVNGGAGVGIFGAGLGDNGGDDEAGEGDQDEEEEAYVGAQAKRLAVHADISSFFRQFRKPADVDWDELQRLEEAHERNRLTGANSPPGRRGSLGSAGDAGSGVGEDHDAEDIDTAAALAAATAAAQEAATATHAAAIAEGASEQDAAHAAAVCGQQVLDEAHEAHEAAKQERQLLRAQQQEEAEAQEHQMPTVTLRAKVMHLETVRMCLTQYGMLLDALHSTDVDTCGEALTALVDVLSIVERFSTAVERWTIAPLLIQLFECVTWSAVPQRLVQIVGDESAPATLRCLCARALELYVPGPQIAHTPATNIWHPHQFFAKRIVVQEGVIPHLLALVSPVVIEQFPQLATQAVATLGALAEDTADVLELMHALPVPVDAQLLQILNHTTTVVTDALTPPSAVANATGMAVGAMAEQAEQRRIAATAFLRSATQTLAVLCGHTHAPFAARLHERSTEQLAPLLHFMTTVLTSAQDSEVLSHTAAALAQVIPIVPPEQALCDCILQRIRDLCASAVPAAGAPTSPAATASAAASAASHLEPVLSRLGVPSHHMTNETMLCSSTLLSCVRSMMRHYPDTVPYLLEGTSLYSLLCGLLEQAESSELRRQAILLLDTLVSRGAAGALVRHEEAEVVPRILAVVSSENAVLRTRAIRLLSHLVRASKSPADKVAVAATILRHKGVRAMINTLNDFRVHDEVLAEIYHYYGPSHNDFLILASAQLLSFLVHSALTTMPDASTNTAERHRIRHATISSTSAIGATTAAGAAAAAGSSMVPAVPQGDHGEQGVAGAVRTHAEEGEEEEGAASEAGESSDGEDLGAQTDTEQEAQAMPAVPPPQLAAAVHSGNSGRGRSGSSSNNSTSSAEEEASLRDVAALYVQAVCHEFSLDTVERLGSLESCIYREVQRQAFPAQLAVGDGSETTLPPPALGFTSGSGPGFGAPPPAEASGGVQVVSTAGSNTDALSHTSPIAAASAAAGGEQLQGSNVARRNSLAHPGFPPLGSPGAVLRDRRWTIDLGHHANAQAAAVATGFDRHTGRRRYSSMHKPLFSAIEDLLALIAQLQQRQLAFLQQQQQRKPTAATGAAIGLTEQVLEELQQLFVRMGEHRRDMVLRAGSMDVIATPSEGDQDGALAGFAGASLLRRVVAYGHNFDARVELLVSPMSSLDSIMRNLTLVTGRSLQLGYTTLHGELLQIQNSGDLQSALGLSCSDEGGAAKLFMHAELTQQWADAASAGTGHVTGVTVTPQQTAAFNFTPGMQQRFPQMQPHQYSFQRQVQHAAAPSAPTASAAVPFAGFSRATPVPTQPATGAPTQATTATAGSTAAPGTSGGGFVYRPSAGGAPQSSSTPAPAPSSSSSSSSGKSAASSPGGLPSGLTRAAAAAIERMPPSLRIHTDAPAATASAAGGAGAAASASSSGAVPPPAPRLRRSPAVDASAMSASNSQVQALEDATKKICQRYNIDLSTIEVQRILKIFQTFKTKTLTPEQFQHALSQEALNIRDASALNQLFNAFDANKDGKISIPEVMVGLAILRRGSMRSRLRMAFQAFDVDGSGTIDGDELKRMVQLSLGCDEASATAQAREIMQQYDTDKTGQLSFPQFQQAVVQTQQQLLNTFWTTQLATPDKPL